MIHQRQVALAQGDLVNFRRLRNCVNRLRKSCRRSKYYASKVEHLRKCDPRKWWKEVKSLSGMQLATRTEPTLISETYRIQLETAKIYVRR